MGMVFAERLVTLVDQHDALTIRTMAKCLGPMAVHPKMKRPGDDDTKRRWSVSALPSGREVFRSRVEAEAYRMAELLWTKCRDVMRLSTREDIVEKLTVEAASWLAKCHAARTVLEPIPERWAR